MKLIKSNLINQKCSDPLFKLAIKSCDCLTLSMIRTTSINVASKRLNRDVSNVALMDGRRTEAVLTEHYLKNNSTHDAFDLQIRKAQNFMYDWTQIKPIVISPDKDKLSKKLNVSKNIAKQIIDDEFNNGYGLSLLQDNVVVIDTPLNILRIFQWLEKIQINEIKIKHQNPERWDNVYLPQIKLFNSVLSCMSKRNKKEASRMNKEIKLPFPEVF